jgi:methionyl-tRNA formyltransferase
MTSLRIIFMGTPEFAVPSLEILIAQKFNVVAVITAPDKPQGRGKKLIPSPVKEAALKHNLLILQPTNLKSPEFIEELKSYKANLQIVVAFRMLPEVVWSMPSLGTFNLHASLLPHYRGAAPINWAIINGETETGVTTFFLKHEIDTGSVIFQEKEPIYASDDAGTLYNRLMKKGSDLVLKTVKAISAGDYPSLPQNISEEIKHAPKIFKETCEINWNQTVKKVVDFVRGLSPYPGAWTVLNGKVYKILKSEPTVDNRKSIVECGHWIVDNGLKIKTTDGWINILEFQPEGKKRMLVAEFLRGNRI